MFRLQRVFAMYSQNELIDLTEQTFSREHKLYLACNEERAFSRNNIYLNCCEALFYIKFLLDLGQNFTICRYSDGN